MIIVKIGGGSHINVKGIVVDLATLSEKFIIIHGANALRDQLAEKLGRPKQVLTSVKGYTSVYSDEKLIDVIMMAYAGLRNKRIVELCQQNGINAVGLTGLDGKTVLGRRNKGIRVYANKKQKIIRDFSGKPQSINKDLLDLLMKNGYVPVITVPIIDEQNCAINTENDEVTRVLQAAVKADTIINFIEAPGFLEDAKDESSVLDTISAADLETLETQADGRMKRKIMAIRKLFEHRPSRVIIADGRNEHPVADALEGKGTLIQ